ncbi:hypothetical protein SLS58_010487 [Diplodia intermedia]|uniref:Rhodopsin domain-containing protein n=1 Tax=Diplodia intermedia TaxID=856260 RepID=A0ABR3T5P2_9PEZI
MESWDGQGSAITGVSISLGTLATCIVCTRMWAVYKRRGWLGLEDAMVALSNVRGFSPVRYGFGLRKEDIAAAGGNLRLALKYFFLFQIFYKCVILFNKLAFLLLYLRVFQIHSFRLICLWSIAFVVVGSFSFIMATLLECLPIACNWNRTVAGGCRCINNSAFRWSWAAFNTLTDVWVALLPIPFIQRLQMSRAKKLGLCLLFALGLFVCVCSAIRMKALVASTRAVKDTTWDSAPAFLWSGIEAAVGLICTCLPSLRWLLSHVIPMLASSAGAGHSSDKNRYYQTGSGSGGGGGGGGVAGARTSRLGHLSFCHGGGAAKSGAGADVHELPGLVPARGRSKVDATATTAAAKNRYGESSSEERIIGPVVGRGEIQVQTCVSVQSSATSAVGVD